MEALHRTIDDLHCQDTHRWLRDEVLAAGERPAGGAAHDEVERPRVEWKESEGGGGLGCADECGCVRRYVGVCLFSACSSLPHLLSPASFSSVLFPFHPSCFLISQSLPFIPLLPSSPSSPFLARIAVEYQRAHGLPRPVLHAQKQGAGPTPGIVLQIPPQTLAEQMALFNYDLFKRVHTREYIEQAFSGSTDLDAIAPNLQLLIRRFEDEGQWVAAEIVQHKSRKEQATMIALVIRGGRRGGLGFYAQRVRAHVCIAQRAVCV